MSFGVAIAPGSPSQGLCTQSKDTVPSSELEAGFQPRSVAMRRGESEENMISPTEPDPREELTQASCLHTKKWPSHGVNYIPSNEA